MEQKKKVGVGVGVIIVKDGKILLGKRKSMFGEGAWSFPGGHLEYNESWEDCAARETMEETGIEIKNIRFSAVTSDIFQSEGKHYITIFMLSDYDSGDVKVMESEKCERWDWFERGQLPKPLFLPIQNLLKQNLSSLENKMNHKMAEVGNKEIIEIARQYNKDGVLW
ncbi:MAG: NUDIX hydrolase, partial [Candidatus Methanoperedens sp.]|nr:NUDIX hydrolase [Candidatus Methanoperedens sp.]